MLYNIFFLIRNGMKFKTLFTRSKKITENCNINLLISVLKRTNLKKVVFKKSNFLN